MTDPAASALARLKQTANKSGRSFQLCLQLFCQEEFLRRLTKSKYMNNLVLKGGLLLYAITDFSSRVTVDMDFLMKRIPNTPEQARIILEEILSSSTNNDYIVSAQQGTIISSSANLYTMLLGQDAAQRT